MPLTASTPDARTADGPVPGPATPVVGTHPIGEPFAPATTPPSASPTTAVTTRVLYLLYRYPQLSQTFVRNEIRALRERGIVVDVVSIEPGQTAGIAAGWAGAFGLLERVGAIRAAAELVFAVARHPRRVRAAAAHLPTDPALRRLTMRRVPALLRRLQPLGYDRVHTHFAWQSCWVARLVADMLDVPASVTVHARDIFDRGPHELDVLEAVDDVVTVCEFNVAYLRSVGVRNPRLSVVPCGVDLVADVPPGEPARPGPDVVAVGRLVPKKGFDTLVEAVALLRDAGAAPDVLLIGDGPERESLAARIDSLSLGGSVTLAGARDHAGTLDAIAGASVFCLPARLAADGDMDALPVVLREAQARSVPIVTTTVAGIPEVVGGDCGWLVAPDDPAALAAALGAALGDPEEAQRRGRVGRARVARTGTVDLQASMLRAVFDSGPR